MRTLPLLAAVLLAPTAAGAQSGTVDLAAPALSGRSASTLR